SFPDLWLSKGMSQLRPEPPFTLGVDLSGTVVSTGSTDSQLGIEAGARVAAVLPYGGAAERVIVPGDAVLELPDGLSFVEGAAMPMNYLTALFALKQRGHVRTG